MLAFVLIVLVHLGFALNETRFFNILTNGEDTIKRVIAVNSAEKALAPCGVCRELMAQLMSDKYKEIEIMMNYEKGDIIILGKLMSRWWI